MAITVTTTTASTIRITIGILLGRHLGDSLHRLERLERLDVLLRAGPRGARRAARLNVVERALVAGVGGVGNLKGKGGGNLDVRRSRRPGAATRSPDGARPAHRPCPAPPLDEHGTAELVRAVPAGLQLPVGPAERGLVRERAQQFVMAAAGFVRARVVLLVPVSRADPTPALRAAAPRRARRRSRW